MARSRVDDLLAQWEEAYKKGLLTFWRLLLLHEQPRYAFELSAAVAQASNETIVADDQSIYRALKRFEGMKIVSSYWEDSPQAASSPVSRQELSRTITATHCWA